PEHLEEGRKLPNTGCIFVGSECSIMSAGDYGDSPRLIPEAAMKKHGKPERTIERSVGHYKEFVLAATGQKPIDYPGSNFNYAAPFSETVLIVYETLNVGLEVKVFPNPVVSTLYFQSNTDIKGSRIQIYHLNGALVHESVLGMSQEGVELEQLSHGVYQVVLETAMGTQLLKIIKQ
ncbi:MAG: T9SS type A sorting domain-containing protein, partial [Bacteroidota bacterium]